MLIGHLSICLLASSVQSLSCVWLCNPMDFSTPGFPVHHQLPALTQTQVHQIDDAIQPSHPLSSPLLLPSIFPSIRMFSSESVLHITWWPKYWSFSFSISPSNEYSGLISFRIAYWPLMFFLLWMPAYHLYPVALTLPPSLLSLFDLFYKGFKK